jgi:hypothetical protein
MTRMIIDFYTIKPFCIGDLGVKIYTCYLNFFGGEGEGARHHLISDAYTKHMRKKLMRKLRVCISS